MWNRSPKSCKKKVCRHLCAPKRRNCSKVFEDKHEPKTSLKEICVLFKRQFCRNCQVNFWQKTKLSNKTSAAQKFVTVLDIFQCCCWNWSYNVKFARRKWTEMTANLCTTKDCQRNFETALAAKQNKISPWFTGKFTRPNCSPPPR